MAPADLRTDCARCFGLCCVAPAFAISADFALDKPAGRPCLHLLADDRCGIHTDLRERGFPACAAFDCRGAGQRVAQDTFGGHSWRESPELAAAMFAVFGVMRQLHELLWLLDAAIALEPAGPDRAELELAYQDVDRRAGGTSDQVRALDATALRAAVNPLLRRTSERVRRAERPEPRDLAGADLVGADLAGADLRAASLRGALLVGADLREADLRWADLTGADLRGADLRGADLTNALFLTQAQLDAAR